MLSSKPSYLQRNSNVHGKNQNPDVSSHPYLTCIFFSRRSLSYVAAACCTYDDAELLVQITYGLVAHLVMSLLRGTIIYFFYSTPIGSNGGIRNHVILYRVFLIFGVKWWYLIKII
ncbi:hypothetical protein JHK84_057150 [Glycine max]|nr:hypothetical protein JHK84_057150 [Glycine max]